MVQGKSALYFYEFMVLPLPLPSYSFRPIYCPWPIVKILGHNIGKMKRRAKIHGGSESIHYIKNSLFPSKLFTPTIE